ncbi:MAG: O-phosphoserine--tRNA ligase [Euryarchaeota archaeon]|nr:O-phosphoserine--tRNA ligase [Euryarchaeota archaeon]
MKRVPIDKIVKIRERSFEEAWKYGGTLFDDGSQYNLRRLASAASKGRPHVLNDLIERMRQRLFELGFDEIINETIFPAEDVMKQWGPTGYAILDRCYYLAALPRPDVGLSLQKQATIKSFGIDLTPEKVRTLQLILHKLKTGELEADELIREIASELHIADDLAIEVFEKAFFEFKELKPLPSNLTLRSHMTAAWFDTLAAVQKYSTVPVKLFAIGPRYRREQREDTTHLRVHNSASCVVMDEDLTIKVGEWIVESFLSSFGFEDFKFKQVGTGTDTYYAPKKHFEAYAYHSDFAKEGDSEAGWLEVADFGLYSPVTLANYSIEYPVLNCGIGVERIAMIMHAYKDIRGLVYPQFHEPFTLSDEELVKLISIKNAPRTRQGQEIQRAVVHVCETHGFDPSPVEFVAWEGMLLDKFARVSVIEPEKDTKLCGPAFRNGIFVSDGNVIGAAKHSGLSTAITYIEAFAAEAAYEIEQAVKNGQDELEVRVRISRSPSDLNIEIDRTALRFITSHHKKIDVRGPVFTTVRMKVT